MVLEVLVSHSWLESYLSNRSQQVSIHDTLSDFKSIMSGVNHGSTLGPLFFLICVNDLFSQHEMRVTYMYANDMTIIVRGKSRAEVIDTANKERELVCSWLAKHKLIVNPTKTKNMILSTKLHKVQKNSKLCLKILSQPICEVTEFKFQLL